ncbi:MAG: FHA domain-containing protein, partial [Acidobacteriota bacterium]|nr:FHA domain-containing protein [Acidobacteriota bacterium]
MAGNAPAKRMAIRLIIERQGAPADQRTFDAEIVTIGSDPASSLALPDPRVAPEQAIILSEGGRLLLINRAEGTRLNGEPLAREARRTLSEGDALQIGPFSVRLAPGQDEEGGERRSPTPVTREAEAPPEGPPAAEADARPRSFAAILDSLRTEEDSFYFEIESAG